MAEYYVYDTLQIAQDAMDFIAQIGGLPLPSKDINGNIVESAAKTERWDVPRKRKDGKYIVMRLPIEFRNKYSNSESYFDTNFPHVIETIQSDWFDGESE